MPNALTILTKDPSIAEWMNFDLLRNEGIRHIASLSGDVWTDHNLHDPGITILEVLCYALTDLGYRNSLSVADLLAKKPGGLALPDDNFFTAAELLTCNPLTVLDYRKMLMNIEGVRNAWLEPVSGEDALLKEYSESTAECKKVKLNGLYNVILELDAFFEGKALLELEGKVDGILKQAVDLLHHHRNLCEDFHDIFVLGDEEIGIKADLEISANADPDEVMTEVMVELQKFLSPQINYLTLKEMLAKGKSMEEIFRGRAFDSAPTPSANGLEQAKNFGFIDTAELEQIERRTELHASDFYRVIMAVPGVNAVRTLKLFNFMGGLKQTSGEDWCLRLTPRQRPVMSPWLSELRFFKNGLEFSPDKVKVTKRFKDRVSGFAKTLKGGADLDSALPQGKFREDLGEYTSIQHEFPLLYRIGEGEMPDNAPVELHVKKQQLKGYLLFFDQLLANYLAQLAHLRDLFAMRPKTVNGQSNGSLKTIFTQKLDNVPELDKLLRYADKEGSSAPGSPIPNPQPPIPIALPLPGKKLEFSTQEQRDLTIRRFIGEFEEGKMELSAEETAPGKFRYVLKSLGEVLLVSPKSDYSTASAALAAGEALNFLGTIPESYQPSVIQKPGSAAYTYSFKLVSKPVAYETYLHQITEKPETAQDRRTRFLNHLLARFSEEFTDYTLLMYATEGKKRDELTIIKDKETFLSDYPRISRDRGRGFNYRKSEPGNISGLERRVESLMGITNRELNGGSYLSNMELAAWEPLHFAVVKNSRDEVVFRGVRGFATAGLAELEALKIKESAKDLANYSLDECTSKNVFGFHLNDENGNLIAGHPLNYESKAKAEKKRNCLLEMAAAAGNCLSVPVENKASGYFTLFDDGEQHPKILFKSEQVYANVTEARKDWLNFASALRKPEPFVKEENEWGGNFSFFVAGTGVRVLARHPKWYCTSKARTAVMEKWKLHLIGKKLRFRIETLPAFYRWQLPDEGKRLPLLESILRFESEEQAVANYPWFFSTAAHSGNWQKQDDDEHGLYGFILKEPEGYEAVRSKWFKTKKERGEALDKVLKMVAESNPVDNSCELDVAELPLRAARFPERYAFSLLGEDGNTAMEGQQWYDSREEAEWAFYQFTQRAGDPAQYRLEREEGTCRFTFQISTPHCGHEAVHPRWYPDKASAKRAMQCLAAFIEQNRLHFEVGYAGASWRPQLIWENLEGYCAPVLVGKNRQKRAEAEADALYWATIIAERPEALRVPENEKDGCFSFMLQPEPGGEILARHPILYPDAESRDKMLESAKGLHTQPSGWKLSAVSELMKPSDGQSDYGGWAIKKGGSLVRHPLAYLKSTERDLVFDELVQLGKSKSLPFSKIPGDKTYPFFQVGGKWRFRILSVGTEKVRVLWESRDEYPTLEAAAKAFDRFLLASASPIHYFKKDHTCNGRFEIELQEVQPESTYGFRLVKKAESIAQHPLTYSKTEKRDAVFTELVRLGKSGTLPFSEISGAEKSVVSTGRYSWSYVIRDKKSGDNACSGNVDDGKGNIRWQSTGVFYSQAEAATAFDAGFLDLLRLATDASKYDLQRQTNCKWKVVLLDENKLPVAEMPVFFSSDEAAHCAAEEEVTKAKMYPFFKECGKWRFRLRRVGLEEDTLLWESQGGFSTLPEADKALRHFLHVATYPGNYFKKNNACAGRFEIEMREVQLESTSKFASPEEAWQQADVFSQLADEPGAFYLFVSPENVCRFGFRAVRPGYLLARHVRRYHQPELREAALHDLHAEARRRLVGSSDFDFDYCKKGSDVFLKIIDRDTKKALWRSASGFLPGATDQKEHVVRYYFGVAGQPEEYRNYYLTLFEYARHADFYEVVQEGPGKFRLALLNADGGVELLAEKDFPTKADCEQEAGRLIRLFRRYPLLKEGEQYFFQYYSFDEDWAPTENEPPSGIIAAGKIIWESSRAYASPLPALTDFGRFVTLLADKSNYQRITENGDHYFSIELTDPDAVLAVHPHTYCSEDEVKKLIAATQATLNGEGLHMVEHILLRPEKNGVKAGDYLIKTCISADEDDDIHFTGSTLQENKCSKTVEIQTENCLIPFADPYSFWMTVVAPYWPRRFQNPDFRKFFETTLRRETPAHIALNILWVGPEQMSLFESKYQAWLTALGLEGDCLLGSTQDDFMEFLFEQIRQGNPPLMLDAVDKNKKVVLDESRLTL